MATGGTGISADKSAGSPGAAYTALGNIVVTSTAANDFTTGSNLTLIFTAPAGFVFQANAGSATGGGNITVVSTVVTTSTVTVTYTAGANNLSNILTISGLQVQGSVRTPASGNITRTSGGGVIAGLVNTTIVGALSQVAGSFAKLQLLMPGETASAGSASGKTGTATSQVAATAFNVIVNAVDVNWNIITTITDVAAITTSNANSILPSNTALTAGTATLSVTLKAAGAGQTVTATDVTDGAKTANTGSAVTVAAGAFAKMQLLLPGETAAPGAATGKTGTATPPVGSVAFNVIINAVDANWNIVSSIHTVSITSTDGSAVLPAAAAMAAGTKTFSVTLKTLGAQTLTATNITDGTKPANTSPSVTVSAGTFVKLQILLPGETAAPGTASGKTGAPTATAAGSAFNITVNAVDANWYVVTSATDVIGITSTDANAVLPSNTALASGTATLSVTLKTAGARTVTATDITNATKTLNTSPSVTVSAGAFTKLIVLLTGETLAPGTATGKSGTATPLTGATSTNIVVDAVDANFNLVSSIDNIAITSSDPAFVPPTNAVLAGGTKTFSVKPLTLGSQTFTATDVTDGTKTASTSTSVTVSPGAFTRILLLLPGETQTFGNTTGKINTPTAQTAGTPFNVTAYAVDANSYVITSATDVVSIASNDVNAVLPANAALVAGTQTFSVTLKTAGSKTITPADVTAAKTTAATTVTVGVGTFAKLQALMPGETAAPGTVTGKTGTPTARVAGTAFNVTVNAVDANWNKVTTVTDVVAITSNDTKGVLPANAALVAGTKQFSVNLKTPTTTANITSTDFTDGTKTASITTDFTVNIGTFVKLQLLMPGESAAPGTTTGKTGTPTGQTAGTSFNITVNAVDAAWNVVPSATDVITFISNDVNAVLPANTALAAGTKTLSATFKTAASKTITAKDFTNTSKTQSTSGATTVTAAQFSQIQILLPGESASAGSATGKTGTPTAQNAGTAFNATVNAVDAYWNKVNTVTDVVALTSTDAKSVMPANTQLVAGTKSLSVNLKTPGTASITATDATDGTKTANVSSTVTVNIGGFAKLQLLLPGETAAPGTTTGKTNTPTAPVAGTPITVTVNAVDAAWNIVSTITDQVAITSNDIYAALPANANLVAGTKTFSVTLKTATTGRTITASDVTNGSKAASASPALTVAAGAYSQLQILLPNETAVPGSPDGKSGTANPPARGTAFNFTVNAVDANFNKITSVTSTVTITSSDGTATLPSAAALVSGTKVFNVNIKSTASTPLPTLTATDGGGITSTVSVPSSIPASNTTDYFRTKTSGLWSDATTWESSTMATSGWHDATLYPTSAANMVTILNAHTVTAGVQAPTGLSVTQLTIATGGQLTIASGYTLTIATGGTASVQGIINNAGTITTTGTLTFLSGGKYQHNFTTTPGTIPLATWNTLSTCEIVGYTSATGTVVNGNQTFGNFIWNCTSQNASAAGVSLGGTASVNDLTVTSTGASTSTFQLGTAGGTVTVRGNYYQTGGALVLNNTATGTETLSITGDFNFTGGTIKTTGGNLIAFAGSTTQNYIKTGSVFSGAVNFAINTGATVSFGTNVIDGSTGTFTVNAGGTLLTDNDNGIGATGTIQVTGTKTYSSSSNFTFSGSNAQVLGSTFPTAVGSLTVNNPSGVTMPAGSTTYTINGALTLTSGNLDMGTNDLAVGGSFSNSGSGVLRTASISANPLPAGKTWNVTVEYYSAAAQNVAQGTYSNILFTSTGTKTFAGGTTSVNGNWTSNDGKIDLITKDPIIQFTGTTQSLDDNGTDSNTGVIFKNVIFGNSGTKTINTGNYSLATNGLLTMSGSAVLSTNGALTVLSDSTGTGNIGPLTSGAIVGNVTVQAFITGKNAIANRGYRLLSSPISSQAAPNTYYDLSFLRGSGSYLTGPGGTDNGFDAAGNSSLFLYREDKLPTSNSFTGGNYRPITAINDSVAAYLINTTDGKFNLPVGNGVLYFFRGNNSTNISTPPSDIVLNTVGPINQGTITVKNWFNYSSAHLAYSTTSNNTSIEGFNLVGNPYPCSIDWNTAFNGTPTSGIYAPHTDQTVYIYNPVSKVYATYLNTSSGGTGTNGATNIIPSGQGFFVHASDTTAQLIFNESAKVNAHPSTLLLNSSVQVLSHRLRLQLSKDSINTDENVIIFNDDAHSGYIRNEDALYLKGSGAVSLSNQSDDNRNLAINQLPFPKKTQVIPLSVSFTATGIYKLGLTEISNIPIVYDIWLRDDFKNDSLDLRANAKYAFNVTSDAATFGGGRFKLILRPNSALDVHLLNFTATKGASNVSIIWSAENESNYTSYILERSIDGKTFTKLDSLTSASLGTYNDLDPYPAKGLNYYRLRQVDVFGHVSYSNIVTVMYAPPGNSNVAANLISLYPNPVRGTLNVAMTTTSAASANYKITVVNASGTVVRTITSSQPAWQGDVSNLSPGTYFVSVINLKDNSLTGKSSFVKL